GQGNIVENIPVLTEMQKVSEGQIQLVAGAGVTKENIKRLLDETGITQAHVGTAVREGKSCFSEIDPNLVQELVEIIK
ncbi:copper homeostasis protein CutC, partial [Enterobacter cloacae]